MFSLLRIVMSNMIHFFLPFDLSMWSENFCTEFCIGHLHFYFQKYLNNRYQIWHVCSVACSVLSNLPVILFVYTVILDKIPNWIHLYYETSFSFNCHHKSSWQVPSFLWSNKLKTLGKFLTFPLLHSYPSFHIYINIKHCSVLRTIFTLFFFPIFPCPTLSLIISYVAYSYSALTDISLKSNPHRVATVIYLERKSDRVFYLFKHLVSNYLQDKVQDP
jgi:hypothetical protein